MINIIISFFIIINVSFYASDLIAGKVYSWTDKNGVIHITNTPPPNGAEFKESVKYKDTTPQEMEDYHRKRKQDRERIETEKKIEKHQKDIMDRNLERKKEQVKNAEKRVKTAKKMVEKAKEKVDNAEDKLWEAKRISGERGKRKEKYAEEILKRYEGYLEIAEDNLEVAKESLRNAKRSLRY
jgi:hypothetical protein